MPRPSKRSLQVADLVHRELACLLKRSVSDPRLTGLTLTQVQMSRDLSQATVFFTLFDLSQADQVLKVLDKASGHIRHELAQSSGLRYTPKLHFKLDENLISANRISELLNNEAPPNEH